MKQSLDKRNKNKCLDVEKWYQMLALYQNLDILNKVKYCLDDKVLFVSIMIVSLGLTGIFSFMKFIAMLD